MTIALFIHTSCSCDTNFDITNSQQIGLVHKRLPCAELLQNIHCKKSPVTSKVASHNLHSQEVHMYETDFRLVVGCWSGHFGLILLPNEWLERCHFCRIKFLLHKIPVSEATDQKACLRYHQTLPNLGLILGLKTSPSLAL